MENSEARRAAKAVLQTILKARKNLRMYPSNNPIYTNTLEDAFEKFRHFFDFKDSLVFGIRLYDIYYEDILIYHNALQKEENLAFFLFKDGLRELTFQKRMPYEEMALFLNIISRDFENEVLDDDTVTLFWESDFRYIQYVVEDAFLVDEDYEIQAVSQAKQVHNTPAGVKAVCDHALNHTLEIQESVEKPDIVAIQEDDRKILAHALEVDADDKIDKLMDILFEVYGWAETGAEFSEAADFLNHAIEYAVRKKNIDSVVRVLDRLKRIASHDTASGVVEENVEKVFAFVGSESVVYLLGDYLDTGNKTDPAPARRLSAYFDKNAVPPLITLLSMLNTIHARRVVLDILVRLCPLDFQTVIRGLDSPEWYVVRNITYVLRAIGDPRAVDYLLKKVDHPDARVRLEIIRALGEMGDSRALPVLADCLGDDVEIQLRVTAIRALGSLGSDGARALLLSRISEKSFAGRALNEKKQYFQVLSQWKDSATVNDLIGILMKKGIFPDPRTDEKRACAAYGLGCIGSVEALPYLYKCRNARSRLLREFSTTAIKRIEHEAQEQP